MAGQKRVFISYSHDSDTHKQWVQDLASFLVEHGIEVILDQWDLRYGDDLPTFMEKAIRDPARVLVICTDNYVQKANVGTGGVGYEKTIATAEILIGHKNRWKFVPIVRNVTGDQKMPRFFGGAYYLDLSDEKDSKDMRLECSNSFMMLLRLSRRLAHHHFFRTLLEDPEQKEGKKREPSSVQGRDCCELFSERFAQSFPGVRGTAWFDDSETVANRLGIFLQKPLSFKQGPLAGWWRGPANLHIEHFEHIEGSHFLDEHRRT